jgi:hypothetical protein
MSTLARRLERIERRVPRLVTASIPLMDAYLEGTLATTDSESEDRWRSESGAGRVLDSAWNIRKGLACIEVAANWPEVRQAAQFLRDVEDLRRLPSDLLRRVLDEEEYGT